MKVTLALKTKPEWKIKTTALKHLKIWVCILHAVCHKFVYYLLCRYVSGVSPQNNAAQNWYCDMKAIKRAHFSSYRVVVFCSVTVLLRHSHLLFYFILGRAICCLIRSLNLCCFLLAILIKNIIFSCFIIILADLFLKLRAVIFILLFKIYLFYNFWEDLECKRSRRHGRNVLLTVVVGVPTLLIKHTHAHTHIYKSFDFCVLLFILTRAITVHVDKQN